MVVPISEAIYEYANAVRSTLRRDALHVDVDASDRKMQKKVREAQLEQYNYILVVGAEEVASRTVNLRSRDNVVHGALPLQEVVSLLAAERDTRSLVSCFAGHGEAAAEDVAV